MIKQTQLNELKLSYAQVKTLLHVDAFYCEHLILIGLLLLMLLMVLLLSNIESSLTDIS